MRGRSLQPHTSQVVRTSTGHLESVTNPSHTPHFEFAGTARDRSERVRTVGNLYSFLYSGVTRGKDPRTVGAVAAGQVGRGDLGGDTTTEAPRQSRSNAA
jgi:hypothetical protein